LTRAGGRLSKIRPVVVVQNNIGNRYGQETIVAAIRDPHGGRILPIFVPLKRGIGGIEKDSLIDAGHLATVSQEALTIKLGSLPAVVMEKVDQALAVSLGLLKGVS